MNGTALARMVMAPPQSAQEHMPVSLVGPPTTWGGVTLGLRDLPMRKAVVVRRRDLATTRVKEQDAPIAGLGCLERSKPMGPAN